MMSTPADRSKKGLGNTEGFRPADGSKPKPPRKVPNPNVPKKRSDGFDIGTFEVTPQPKK